ncbi:hypothetical protein F444_14222 [Phytophthora nicotianae P1976]|nr:hypothetical protein F444_14222 [Phytophthora nicotianae P1976]
MELQALQLTGSVGLQSPCRVSGLRMSSSLLQDPRSARRRPAYVAHENAMAGCIMESPNDIAFLDNRVRQAEICRHASVLKLSQLALLGLLPRSRPQEKTRRCETYIILHQRDPKRCMPLRTATGATNPYAGRHWNVLTADSMALCNSLHDCSLTWSPLVCRCFYYRAWYAQGSAYVLLLCFNGLISRQGIVLSSSCVTKSFESRRRS